MPGTLNTLLIEGSFEELAEELGQYIDDTAKKAGIDHSPIRPDVSFTSEELSPDESAKRVDDTLKKLVSGSAALNAAPEREFIAAYNLLVHLVRQSPVPEKFLPRICQNLSQPITSSPHNGSGLALSVLTTIFNTIAPDSELRFHVFRAVLAVVKKSGSFDALRTQLKNLETWLASWGIDDEQQRELYLEIADVAEASGDHQQSYDYLLRALRTIPAGEASAQDAQELSTRALAAALSDPNHYDFQDLTSLDTIQALRKSDPTLFELLEIFNAEQLDEYNDFLEEHDGWLETHKLDSDILARKMRLLTLASLAASSQTRSLPYQHISRALQVPSEDVEMWVIDVIRAGLVEGKLSQLNQSFQVHRSTYRVFGEKQWTEIALRLDTWRTSLEGVLGVIRQEREKMIREKERELREVEGKANGSGYSRPSRKIEADEGIY